MNGIVDKTIDRGDDDADGANDEEVTDEGMLLKIKMVQVTSTLMGCAQEMRKTYVSNEMEGARVEEVQVEKIITMMKMKMSTGEKGTNNEDLSITTFVFVSLKIVWPNRLKNDVGMPHWKPKKELKLTLVNMESQRSLTF